MKKNKIDKSRFKDSGGRYLTQSLFIEFDYNADLAVFTFDGEDKVYKGKTYYSLKKMYLEMEDIIEYTFATECLFDWDHWQRLCANKLLFAHISKWREELDLKLASQGMQKMLDSADDGNAQAIKYLADRGWDKKRGRASKEEKAKAIAMQQKVDDEFTEDFERLELVHGNNQ